MYNSEDEVEQEGETCPWGQVSDTLDRKGSLSGQSRSRQKMEIYGHIGGDFGIHTGAVGGEGPRGVP